MYVETNPKYTGSYNSALRLHRQAAQTMRHRTIISTTKATLNAHFSNSTAQKTAADKLYPHTALIALPTAI